MSMLLGSCSSPPPLLDQILRLGELRVVTSNSPTTFYFDTDEPHGIEYELARGFAARLGVNLRVIIEDRFPQLLPGGWASDVRRRTRGQSTRRPRV
jgi:membrane-bound lytic murein transglycosylase F